MEDSDQSQRRYVKGQGHFQSELNEALVLRGALVELVPMTHDHVEPLIEAASSGELWHLEYTSVPSPEQMAENVAFALEQRGKGVEFPFVVRLKNSGKVVGTTRYYYIEATHRNLSIGYTWYSETVHRTGVNTETKLLLLIQAFERMNCISVQWHTDHLNYRSQAAIKRLGAKFEGVLRNHRIMPDGRIRHTHCFSMLDDEWPRAKKHLQSRLDHYANL